MSEQEKPREFWINRYFSEYAYWDTLVTANPGHDLKGALHVIEMSAYTELLSQAKAMREALGDLTLYLNCGACDENHTIAHSALKHFDDFLAKSEGR